MEDDSCISCCQRVRPRQEALCCDRCSRWQHRTCGTGISRKLYRETCKGKGIDVWLCNNCTENQHDTSGSESSPPDEAMTSMEDAIMQEWAETSGSERSPSSDDEAEPMLTNTEQFLNTRALNSTFIVEEKRNSPEDDALDASFDIPRASTTEAPEIMEDSLQDPPLPDDVLPDTPVTYSIVEGGTQRNASKLVSSDGYEFTKKTSKANFTYWRCIKRSQKSNCPATVSQKGQTFKTNTKPHNHQADKGALKKVAIAKEVKATARNQLSRPARQIVDDIMLKFIEPDDHELPKINNLTRSNLRPKEPTSIDFELDFDFLQCDDFLVADIIIDDQRHMLFSTPEQLHLLRTAKRWFCDDTFKMAADPFSQLWSIHAFIRKGDTTKQVLEKVKEIVGTTVEGFVLDFEKGAWKAIQEIFPEAQISGCVFHFCQAVWRKAQELGLKTTYSERGAVYRYIRNLLSLPFLPAQDIEPAFEHLEQRSTSPELQALLRYMRNTWIDSSVWTPRTWSIYKKTIRTNNDVEGWHTRINAGRTHIKFYVLLPLLRREANLVSRTERLVSEEQMLRDQRQRTKDIQGKLHKLWDLYADGQYSASRLLRECSSIYGPVDD